MILKIFTTLNNLLASRGARPLVAASHRQASSLGFDLAEVQAPPRPVLADGSFATGQAEPSANPRDNLHCCVDSLETSRGLASTLIFSDGFESGAMDAWSWVQQPEVGSVTPRRTSS